MGEGCRTFILSLLNDDTPFGIYTQDRTIAFRFGVEVITDELSVSCPLKTEVMSSETSRNMFANFCVCVCRL